MARMSDPLEDPDFVNWYATEPFPSFSMSQLEKDEKRIRVLIKDEVRFLQEVQKKSPKLYPLAHKQIELK